MRRISIRSLMAFVVIAAVGVAALRNADELWSGAMLMIALAAVGAAILGASSLPSRERAWWLGFAVFSGGYLAVALSPLTSELPTSQFLGYVHSQVNDEAALDDALRQLIASRQALFSLKVSIAQVNDEARMGQLPDPPELGQLLDSKAAVDRRIAALRAARQEAARTSRSGDAG